MIELYILIFKLLLIFLLIKTFSYWIDSYEDIEFINDEKSIRIKFVSFKFIKDEQTGFENKIYYSKEKILWQK